MDTLNETQVAAPDAMAFLGNYLRKEDVNGKPVVTIANVRAETIEGQAKQKLVAVFNECNKPLVLNSTNIKRLAAIFGSHNTGLWRGQVMLYVDENIEFGGKRIGGIRVDAAPSTSGAINGSNNTGPLG